MNLLLYEKIELIVDAPFADVHKIIADHVGPKGLRKICPSLFGTNPAVNYESALHRLAVESKLQKEYHFEGELSESTFTIERAISYRSSFLPIMYGILEPLPYGTKITVEMKLSPLVISGLLCLSVLVLAGSANFPSFTDQVGFVGGAIVMTYADFWFEVWRSKKKFLEIFRNARIVRS